MKTSLQQKLVNGRQGDPALFVDILREKRAVLFDCGVLSDLSPSELLRVTDVFVSHAHIDHFIGFDHLLRLHLGRGRRVRVYGPRGITHSVRGKLSGYSWNLVRHQRLVFEVHEVDGDAVRITDFPCRERFRPGQSRRVPGGRVLLRDDLIEVEVAVVDHRIPCLAFRLTEHDFYNVNPDRLAELGHRPGAWLNDLKAWARAGRPEGGSVTIDGHVHPAEPLAALLLIHQPGQRLGYVAAAAGSPSNCRILTELLRGVDLLYSEGAFLHADLERAQETYHLTARQAGEIARAVSARRLELFHFSPKYDGRFEELVAEAEAAFRGPTDADTADRPTPTPSEAT